MHLQVSMHFGLELDPMTNVLSTVNVPFWFILYRKSCTESSISFYQVIFAEYLLKKIKHFPDKFFLVYKDSTLLVHTWHEWYSRYEKVLLSTAFQRILSTIAMSRKAEQEKEKESRSGNSTFAIHNYDFIPCVQFDWGSTGWNLASLFLLINFLEIWKWKLVFTSVPI